MQREGQGSGNGCGRHGEQMRLQPFVQQAITLMDSEAVLFIHHDQSKPGKHHRILQKGVRSNQNMQRAIGQVVQQTPPFRFGCGTGEQLNTHIQLRKPGAEVAVVLLSKHFRRRHQGPLPLRLNGGEQSCNRHNGFAGPHIPLNQSGHGFRPLQIGFDLAEDPGLCTGEAKWKQRQKTLHQAIGLTLDLQLGSGARPQLMATAQQTELHQQKLVEHQTFASLLEVVLGRRRMECRQRIRYRNDAITVTFSGGERFRPLT